jgi:hypothetical protein
MHVAPDTRILEGPASGAALRIVPPAGVATLSPEGVVPLFDEMEDGSALVLMRPGDLSSEMRAFLVQRFVEIDHVEMRVHYPDTPIHAMADNLLALSVSNDVVALCHSPNLYPSNSAFDPEQPQARAAFDHIAEVLSDGRPHRGAIGYAAYLSRCGRLDEALNLLERFGTGEG